MKTLRTFLIIATIALFAAIIPIWPYGFYTLLRLLVCATSAYLAYKVKYIANVKSHRIPLVVIAVLFNPLIPVYFMRAIWFPIDLTVGIYFLLLINKLKEGVT